MQARRVVPILAALMVALGMATGGTTPANAAPPPGPAFAPLGTTTLPSGFKAIETDPLTQRVFVSSPTSNKVTVLNVAGEVLGDVVVPGAGSLLLDGPTLYVAATTGGRIDTFNTTTLAPTGSYGAGVLLKPQAVVKAGGRLWTTTGDCGNTVQLVSIRFDTGAVSVHQAIPELMYCPLLMTNPNYPNLLLGFDQYLSPATVVRLDVSSGAPVVTASLRTDNSNAKDGEVMPNGQTFAIASGSPYEIRTYGVDPLHPNGIVYPTGHYPNAVEATAANGGLVAAGRDGAYDNDIDVFRLGDPSQTLLRHDFGSTGNTVYDAGLAFSADGTRLFVVSGATGFGSANLTVFGPPDAGGRYQPLPPARILDTRTGVGGPAARIGSGATVDVQVTGQGGVPLTGVSAVAMNVTVTQPSATSFLTLYPTGTTRPLASNLNYDPGKTVPNLVVVKVGTGGKVSMYNSAGAADVIFDVAGWFSDPAAGTGDDGRYTALVPSRILDTRDGTGGGVRLGPGDSFDLQVAGRGGVPSTGAMAAVLNVVATDPTATSFLTVHPTGGSRPVASNLNFNAGDTVANRVMAKLGTGGRVTIYNVAGSTDVVVDVGGWYNDTSVTPGNGTFHALPPARVLDTRDDTAGVAGPRPANTSVAVQVTGRGGVPATGVSAVILNVTVTEPSAPGFLTIFPSGTAKPLASDLNYAGGETRPNLTVVRVGTGGYVDLYTSTTTHVVFDVAGWMS